MSGFSCQPLLAFDSSDSEFVRGFEAGRIWTLARESPSEPLECYVHVENAEMIMRIAEATGRSAQGDEIGEGWLLVRFGTALPARPAASS